MSWSTILYGDFTLDASKESLLRKTLLDMTKLHDVDLATPKEIVALFEPTTVEQALAMFPTDPLEFLTVDIAGGAVKMRGTLHEDEYRDLVTQIACVPIAIGACGGSGALCVTSPEEDFLITLDVRGPKVTAKTEYGVNNPRGFSNVKKARQSAGYLDVVAAIGKALDAIHGPRPAPKPAAELSLAHAAIHRDTIAALLRVEPKAFMVAVGSERLTDLGADKRAILARLASPFATNAKAALRLLRHFDADAAETCAVRHANEPVDPTLAEGIAWALAGRWSDESLDAVVSILETTKPPLDEYAVSRIVRLALASSTNARAGACALALLTAAAKTLPKSSAASVGPDVDALIFAVGELREMKARPLLVSLAKHEALTRSAKSALQRIVHGPNATGFHYGPRGRLIANKRKPRKKR